MGGIFSLTQSETNMHVKKSLPASALPSKLVRVFTFTMEGLQAEGVKVLLMFLRLFCIMLISQWEIDASFSLSLIAFGMLN